MWNLEAVIVEVEHLVEQAQEALIYLKRADAQADAERYGEALGNLAQALTELQAPYGTDDLQADIEEVMAEIEEQMEEDGE